MSRKCNVKNCKSFDGECSFFGVPKDSLNSWTNIIEQVNGCISKIKFVCEKHFLPKYIIQTYAEDNTFVDVKFPKPVRLRLVKYAVPKIFDDDQTELAKVCWL